MVLTNPATIVASHTILHQTTLGRSVEPLKIWRRCFLSSAFVRKGVPSSCAFRFVIASDRLRAIDVRSAEAPEAAMAFRRSMSSWDQGLIINGTLQF